MNFCNRVAKDQCQAELTWSTEWPLELWSQARMHRQQPLCSHFSCLEDIAKEAYTCGYDCPNILEHV